jgi:hypothetical protein
MQLISRDELKQKLERKDQFKLVMALGDWEYHAKHIPGSLHFPTLQEARASLSQDDEIVVYCSGYDCSASERNEQRCRIHWRFTCADARAQMHDLYPSPKFKLD